MPAQESKLENPTSTGFAGSVAAFRVGELQLFQTVFARSNDNSVPWSREHLYPRSPE